MRFLHNVMAENERQVNQLDRYFISDNFGLKYANKYAFTSVFNLIFFNI